MIFFFFFLFFFFSILNEQRRVHKLDVGCIQVSGERILYANFSGFGAQVFPYKLQADVKYMSSDNSFVILF